MTAAASLRAAYCHRLPVVISTRVRGVGNMRVGVASNGLERHVTHQPSKSRIQLVPLLVPFYRPPAIKVLDNLIPGRSQLAQALLAPRRQFAMEVFEIFCLKDDGGNVVMERFGRLDVARNFVVLLV